MKTKSGIRMKTRYTGVYARTAKTRIGLDGKPDICYDIVWRTRDGKVKFKKIGWRSENFTAQDAATIRAEFIRADRFPELAQEPEVENKDITLQELWEQYKSNWLYNLKNRRKIENRYNLYIQPSFGKRKISSISTIDIEKFKQALLTEISYTGKIGLNHGSVCSILSDFRSILKKSIEWNLYSGTLPTFRLPPPAGKRERYLTPQDAKRFLDDLQYISCHYYFIAKISLYTGLRLGEILNLKISDIDIDAKVIYVNGKTGHRVSYFPDDKKFLNEIASLIEKSKKFLFVDKKGTLFNSDRISSEFSSIIHAMGFNKGICESKHKFVFHTLRHTFCSWLAIAGIPLYTIAQLAGHANVQMTQRYAKLSPDAKREAINCISKPLGDQNCFQVLEIDEALKTTAL